MVRREGSGPAVIAGPHLANRIGRMTAADTAKLVRGMSILAAAAKAYRNGFIVGKEFQMPSEEAAPSAFPRSSGGALSVQTGPPAVVVDAIAG